MLEIMNDAFQSRPGQMDGVLSRPLDRSIPRGRTKSASPERVFFTAWQPDENGFFRFTGETKTASFVSVSLGYGIDAPDQSLRCFKMRGRCE